MSLEAGLMVSALAAALLTSPGCVTKATADAKAKAAYLAGQQEAIARMRESQAGNANIRINGRVQIPLIPWVEGLTLMKAIVTAEYQGAEPTEIILVRNGIASRVDVKKLLAGEDLPLQAGDLVQIMEPQADLQRRPAQR